jgi:hypothetical protein
MSIADLLAQPPPNKPWANLYVNSITTVVGSTGSTGSIFGSPFTIKGNPANFGSLLNLVTTNTSPNSSVVSLSSNNASNTSGLSIILTNDPSPASAIWVSSNFSINSINPSNTISLNPNFTTALTCTYDSPGQTHTTIQNLQLPTGGGTATNLNYYEELTTTLVFSGPWASSYTRNIYFTRIGRIVTMKIDGIIQAGTISSVITTSGSIPSRFQPATSTDSTSFVSNASLFDNNRITNGILIINSNGTLQLQYSSVAGTAVDYGLSSGNGNSSGFNNLAITYSV